MSLRPLAAGLAALTVLALGACASDGAPKPRLTAEPQRSEEPASTRKAINLLHEGKREPARAVLQALLAQNPRDADARKLMDQLDRDPKLMLGAQSKPYKVRPGETMSMLAGRFLGDSLLFYALARYNGMEAPTMVQPGQVLRIPLAAKPAAPSPAVAKRTSVAQPKSAAASPPAPAQDAVAAGRLRSAALEQMNRGGIDRAVTLLRQAAQLAPDDALIKRDLERAVRIQSTVKARS